MCLLNERRNAAAPLLFVFAGVAYLAVALLSLRQNPLIAGMQLLPALLFFLAAYLQHRRLR
jgi:hypothetical protein